MLSPSLEPPDYTDPERFRDEQAALRAHTWLYAGLATDVAAHNDYVTIDVGDRSIVVQNFKGELRAFVNTCTHRLSRLRACRTGSGPLRCPYHGWTFDAEGLPVGIPHRQTFPILDDAVVRSLALERWELELCGDFIFVREGVDPSVPSSRSPSLRDYLGSYFERLLTISSALGAPVERNELTIRANWKICVENTLESYHVDVIHPETFKRLGASGRAFEFEGAHSAWESPLDAKVTASFKRLEKQFVGRSVETSGYSHTLVFPAMTIATSFGASFSIQSFEAVSVNETRFVSRIFLARLGDGDVEPSPVHRAFSESVIAFNRDVFEEDRVICEQVQLGAAQARRMVVLSELEARVGAFQATIANLKARSAARG